MQHKGATLYKEKYLIGRQNSRLFSIYRSLQQFCINFAILQRKYMVFYIYRESSPIQNPTPEKHLATACWQLLGVFLLDQLILKGVGEVEKKKPKKKERKEHLSFKDIEELMGVHEQVLKKKHGAYKRVR